MEVIAALSLKYLYNAAISKDDSIIFMVDFNIDVHKDRCPSLDKSTSIFLTRLINLIR